jgi:hypothetical protein
MNWWTTRGGELDPQAFRTYGDPRLLVHIHSGGHVRTGFGGHQSFTSGADRQFGTA